MWRIRRPPFRHILFYTSSSKMRHIADIRIAEFDYPLPDERIAKHPVEKRDECKMLVRNGQGHITHHAFKDLPSMVPQGTMMICNNTRVINARMKFQKATGASIEIFCLEPISPVDYAQMFQAKGSCRWSCLVGNSKRWKDEPLTKTLHIDSRDITLTARRIGPHGNSWEIEFAWDDDSLTFATIIEAAGYIPIPPYLNRLSEDVDSIDYQTVYSKIKGSVAAPTAGLHFTQEVIDRLIANGITMRELTLHVGAGTFQPVKSETIGDHPMHTEVFSVSRRLIDEIIGQLTAHRHIIAVGTTSVRTLESLPYLGALIMQTPDIKPEQMHVDQWNPYQEQFAQFDTLQALQTLSRWFESNGIEVLTASTSIMIAPGFHWRIVDGIVTNFHQPQSTLLLLVSSFIDRQTSIDKQATSKTNASDSATTSEWRQEDANDNFAKPEWQQKENSFCETKSEWRQEDADDNFAKPECQQQDESDNIESPECESSNDTTLECQQKDNSDNKAKPEWRKMYDQALANDYRFLSYGDSSLLTTW